MYRILSATPMEAVDGHIDAAYADRAGWSQDMGATILPIMVGDDPAGWLESTFGPAMEELKAIEPAPL